MVFMWQMNVCTQGIRIESRGLFANWICRWPMIEWFDSFYNVYFKERGLEEKRGGCKNVFLLLAFLSR